MCLKDYNNYPLETFDYPEAHVRHPFEPDLLGYSIDRYTAGSSVKFDSPDVRNWMRGHAEITDLQLHVLEEVVHQLKGYELMYLHLKTGTTTYEFVRMLRRMDIRAWQVVHYVNFFSTQERPDLPPEIDWLDVREHESYRGGW